MHNIPLGSICQDVIFDGIRNAFAYDINKDKQKLYIEACIELYI